jgi:tetratricopeptide (TPR) repeat protein
MTDRPEFKRSGARGPKQPNGGSDSVPSRDAVVNSILRYTNEPAPTTSDNQYQLRRLNQALRNRKGRFGLIFAVCNEIPLRRLLSQQLIAGLLDQKPVELELNGSETTLLDTLLAIPGAPEPLFVYGIERLLLSGDEQRARRQNTLQELQLRREHFRDLGRPLLLWMPEYVYALIGKQATDFWSWQGNAFFFVDGQPTITERERHQPQPSARPRQPEYGAPTPASVVGREEKIAEAARALNDGWNVVLHGFGGAGKSELALYIADILSNHFPDGQIRVTLHRRRDDPRSVIDGLRQIIRTFRPDAELPSELAVLSATCRSLLRGRRVLIVIDDAPDADQVRPFLPPNGSVLLVTSREPLDLPHTVQVSLDQLSASEARALLQSIAPRVSPEVADELCALCNYVPLAIRIVGGSISETPDFATPDVHLAAFVGQSRDELRRLRSAEAVDTEAARSEISLKMAFNLGYQTLSSESARVLRQASVFRDSFDAVAEEAVCEDPENRRLNDLVRRNLAFTDNQTEQVSLFDDQTNRYRLHGIIRRFAFERLESAEYDSVALAHATLYFAVLKSADDAYAQGGEMLERSLRLLDIEWENIRAGQEWAAAHISSYERAAVLCSAYPDAGFYLLESHLHPRERIEWREAALEAARHLGDREVESRHLTLLARAYRDLGQPRQALSFLQRALDVARETGDRGNEAVALATLGLVHLDLGMSRRALDTLLQVLADAREIGDRTIESTALGGIGRAHEDLGDYSQAAELYEQTLAVAREAGHRRNEISALYSLGHAYEILGRYGEAMALYEQALATAREGGDRRSEALILQNLGSMYEDLGETSNGLDTLQQALVAAREVGDRRNETVVLGGLGEVYTKQGDYSRALDVLEQALVVARDIEDRNNESVLLGYMGLVYEGIGDYKQAIALYEQALAVAKKFGHRRNKFSAQYNLALAYEDIGDYHRALDLYEQALAGYREIGDRYGEAIALVRLAGVLGELDGVAQAISHAESALKILEQIGAPETAAVREQLADWRTQEK